jgi:hypothetical protein
MKNLIIITGLLVLISCNPPKQQAENTFMKYDPFPLEVPEQNSLLAGWEKKAVLETMMIDDMEQDAGWQVTGIGEMSYTEERAKDGVRSLRFRTSLRDEEHYKKNRSQWDSFNGGQGGSSSVRLQFNKPQDWSGYNRLSFWVYVHPTTMPTYSFNIIITNEGFVSGATTSRRDHFIQDLKPGEWNHVILEFPHLVRDKVTLFTINQILRGHNPEEEGIVTYDIDNIELQKVETDQYEGWNVASGKFSFNHIGYRPSDIKVALAGTGAGSDFQITDTSDNVVYSGNVKTIETINGTFSLIDFSDLKTEGTFRIRSGSIESNPFPINTDIWLKPIFNVINFFFCERCGFHVPGVHLECHRDWQGFRGDEKKIINGGWHDAGDLSQGYWRSAMAVFAMLNNLDALETKGDAPELSGRLRTEIAWGLDWLLKVRFGDGYHMSWALGRIYTDNKVGTIDDMVAQAQNVPWENFLAAAVLGRCAEAFKNSDPELAERARKAAIEDWEAAVASRETWDQADYREASWGVTSSVILNKMTREEKYKKQALLIGDLLIKCQEQRFIEGIPITGYFYTSSERQRVIHNYHAAFEEAPLIALSHLCMAYTEEEKWIEWYAAAVLHSEFFMKRGSSIAAPYDLVPNSVWSRQEIMSEKDEKLRGDLLRQFEDGTKLNDQYVLRTFPIYFNDLFHGNTNINLSSAWALAEASGLRKDKAGMEIAGKQLQWVLGANPFSQSLMYGTGYDFAPHFAYCLKDLVGALPVGMDCMSEDDPFWSGTNTATYKEIWVEPVSRFLGAVSLFANYTDPASNGDTRKVQINAETNRSENGEIELTVTIAGKGKHKIGIKTFNAVADKAEHEAVLSTNKPVVLKVRLTDINPEKPYVAVIMADNDPDLCSEVVGSFIKPSF